jgi:phage FluMu protein Com
MKLKRCPFCNSHDLEVEASAVSYQIKCMECRALGPTTLRDKADAVRLWNNGPLGTTAMVNMQRKFTNRNDLKEIEL